jgi:hypothetical protein
VAVAVIEVKALDLPYVRAIIFAAVDLLNEVEDSDAALIPDAVSASAAKLRSALERGVELER